MFTDNFNMTTGNPNEANPAPGWFPDPNKQARLRWWDGQEWTDYTDGQPDNISNLSIFRALIGITSIFFTFAFLLFATFAVSDFVSNMETHPDVMYQPQQLWSAWVFAGVFGVLAFASLATWRMSFRKAPTSSNRVILIVGCVVLACIISYLIFLVSFP